MMAWFRRTCLFTMAALMATGLAAVPSVAGASASGAKTITAAAPAPTVTPNPVTAGSTLTVTGTDCSPEFGPTNIFASLVDPDGNLLSTASTSPEPTGDWEVVLSVPASSATGTYSVYSTCDQYNSAIYFPAVPVSVDSAASVPWSVQSTVNKQGPTGAFQAVACQSSTFCVAVGEGVSSAGIPQAQVDSWKGTSWAAATAPAPSGATDIGLNAAACSSSSCMAVGSYTDSTGRRVTLADTWTGSGWVLDKPTDPVGASGTTLDGVSCQGSVCVAVGSYFDYVSGQYEQVPLIERWSGSAWTVEKAALPGQTTGGNLTSVSCTTTSACTAVGFSFSNIFDEFSPIVETWGGAAWTVKVPGEPSGGYYPTWSGVSCTAPTACTAIGSYYNASFEIVPLIERWNGAKWSQQTLSVPKSYGASVDAISCATATSCLLVGSYYQSAKGQKTLSAQWNGSAWTVQPVSTPAGVSEASLNSVSCVGSVCEAAGSYFGTTGIYETLFEGWNGSGWTRQTVPNLTGATGTSLSAVSCTSSRWCVAVGAYASGTYWDSPLIEAWNGTAWSIQSSPFASGDYDGELSGISCTSPTACLAVGQAQSATSSEIPLAETWNGTKWTAQTIATKSTWFGSGLTSVSCVSTSCLVVGYYVTSAGERALAETWNGTKWAISSVPTPTGTSYSGLYSVSCSAPGACTAVGADNSSSGTLAVRWNGTTWTRQSIPSPAGVYGSELDSVSCGAASACTAVGGTYTDTGQGVLTDVWNGKTWTTGTSAPTGGSSGVLQAISCTGATTCTAVGTSSLTGYDFSIPLAETWNGATWTAQPTPNLPSFRSAGFTGVSCLSATSCAAVGNEQSGAEVSLAEVEGGA